MKIHPIGSALMAAVAFTGFCMTFKGDLDAAGAERPPRIVQADTSQPSEPSGKKPGICRVDPASPDCLTRAEAKKLLGDQWPEFLGQTTDRAYYERTFLRLWLNQETP